MPHIPCVVDNAGDPDGRAIVVVEEMMPPEIAVAPWLNPNRTAGQGHAIACPRVAPAAALISRNRRNSAQLGAVQYLAHDPVKQVWRDEAVGKTVFGACNRPDVISGPGELIDFVQHDP